MAWAIAPGAASFVTIFESWIRLGKNSWEKITPRGSSDGRQLLSTSMAEDHRSTSIHSKARGRFQPRRESENHPSTNSTAEGSPKVRRFCSTSDLAPEKSPT